MLPSWLAPNRPCPLPALQQVRQQKAQREHEAFESVLEDVVSSMTNRGSIVGDVGVTLDRQNKENKAWRKELYDDWNSQVGGLVPHFIASAVGRHHLCAAHVSCWPGTLNRALSRPPPAKALAVFLFLTSIPVFKCLPLCWVVSMRRQATGHGRQPPYLPQNAV